MGTWAFEPWDNDEAADWYGELMDRTRLREAWLEGIQADPGDAPATVRAAGALFLMLGRVYVWPIDHLDRDLETAIAALTGVAESGAFAEAPELGERLALEIEELKSRRRPDAAAPPASAASAARPWQRFW